MGAASAAYCALSAVSKPIEEVPKVIPAWQDGAWKVRYARLVMCIRVTSLAAVVCAGGIVLLTLVLGAADASYLRSGATRPLIGNQNKTTRAVFIAQNKRGSARHRGYDAARIVGGTVAPCDASVASIPADMFVHVKYPCEHARPVQAFHVFDRIDNVKSYAASTAQNPMPSPWFDAEITSNKAQLRQCGNRTCARIPHHANLNCWMHVDRTLTRRRPVLGLVGSNNMPVPHPLLEQLRKTPCYPRRRCTGADSLIKSTSQSRGKRLARTNLESAFRIRCGLVSRRSDTRTTCHSPTTSTPTLFSAPPKRAYSPRYKPSPMGRSSLHSASCVMRFEPTSTPWLRACI